MVVPVNDLNPYFEILYSTTIWLNFKWTSVGSTEQTLLWIIYKHLEV